MPNRSVVLARSLMMSYCVGIARCGDLEAVDSPFFVFKVLAAFAVARRRS